MFTQRPGNPDRLVKPVTVGSVFTGGPRRLGVRPPAPTQTTQIVPGTVHQAAQPTGSQWTQGLAGASATSLTPGSSAPKPTNSATTQTQPGPSPLDSTYFANVASNQFKVGNQINALNTQGGLADTALQASLGNLAYQEPRDELRAEQAANNRGALYSTVYDQQLGDLVHGYQTKQTALQTSHDNGALQRAAQIAALQGGIPLFNSQQAAAAAVRAANLNAANKALGQSTKPLVKSPPKATPVATAAARLAARIAKGPHAKPNPNAKGPNSVGAMSWGFVRQRNGSYLPSK